MRIRKLQGAARKVNRISDHTMRIKSAISSIRNAPDLSQIPCLLLVGGLGTRLRAVVDDVPKPMAAIQDRPFLDYLVSWLQRQGLRRLVMCAGYQADELTDHFGDGSDFGVEIAYSVEVKPLGTWGALRHARAVVDLDEPFFVLNGDSWMSADLPALMCCHLDHNATATLGLARVADTRRFGRVEYGPEGRITGFKEKGRPGPGWINGGVYVFDSAVFDHVPAKASSLEREALPVLLQHSLFGLPAPGLFVDIGVPEDYLRLHASPDAWLAALNSLATGDIVC